MALKYGIVVRFASRIAVGVAQAEFKRRNAGEDGVMVRYA
jgi:hypothetical protein